MEMVNSFLNENWNVIVAALVIVAVLIVGLLVLRAFTGTVRGGRRGARLAISEYRELDKSRRLVLVRRDGVEHLLLIGGAQDLVIETRIGVSEQAERDETYLHRPAVSGPV